jgi:transposase
MRLSSDGINYIKQNHAAMSIKDLAKHLNCSEETIRKHAKAMGLPKKKEKVGEEVENYIREHFATTPTKKIADTLGVAISTVILKAKSMGCKAKNKVKRKWRRASINVLKDTSLSHRQAAEATGRSYAAVKAKRRELGIVKRRLLGLNPPYNAWTDEELKYLVENYSKMSKKEIAGQLKRSMSAVTSKAYELDLTRKKNRQ